MCRQTTERPLAIQCSVVRCKLKVIQNRTVTQFYDIQNKAHYQVPFCALCTRWQIHRRTDHERCRESWNEREVPSHAVCTATYTTVDQCKY